ncbi:protein kinase [Nonomuraea sp. NPDC046570]|uniref:serine/threonine-protein kinase n=1 Tax=Nonomuraea sp. NPDC046570 TaxID=3155255 RepID=UPI0033DC85E0
MDNNTIVPFVPGPGDSTIAGRYRVLRALGQGGMGTVWLAHDELLQREVAIKEVQLPPSLTQAERAEACQRTMREAMAAAQLRHPGILKVHDVLQVNGLPWIVMELLRGRDLKDAVAQDGPWPPERTAELGLRVLDALSAAHAQGIQHRDVKPANVFLTDDGRVVLTDFGIARLEDQATITESGLLIGSPGFIAPERLRGERGGPESDLWSLAATLYATVEGTAPYVGTSPMAVLRDALTLPPRPPQRAGHLGPVLMAMLAREPYQRPGAQAAAQLLQRVARGEAALAPVPAKSGGGKVALLAAGGLAALLAVVGGVVWLQSRSPSVPPQTAPRSTAVVTPSATPSATPTPSPAESARFTSPVDFCATLTARQLKTLVPKAAPAGKPTDNGCSWTAQGNGLSVVPKRVDDDDPWNAGVEAALEEFANKLNANGSETKITWQWSDIGMTKRITQRRPPATELSGVGDEAFRYEYLNSDGRIEYASVVFRLSNMVVGVDYVNVAMIGDNARIRDTVRDAARQIAEAMNRQE